MVFPYPYVGPIAIYNNLPIEPQFYQPSRFVISAISLGQTTTITTTEDNNYVVGQEVRLLIPQSFGSYQLNQRKGFVISIPADDQFELDINSSMNVDAFISSSATTQAQCVAIGDINSGQTNTGRTNNLTYVPGSFINISPL
jgi:hypothetical protein